MDTTKFCRHCQKPATFKCSNCKNAFYCNKEHQKQNWKLHKTECRSIFKIVRSDQLGRYMIANRDIKAGETILEELPLIIGPKMASYPLCLGCNRTLNSDFVKCRKCGWPICDENCKYLPRHKKECQVMSESEYFNNIFPGSELKLESAYSCITPIRCLLLDKIQFDLFMNLQSHLEERLNTSIYKIYKTNLVFFIKNVLKLQTDELTILKIAAILDTNCFEIRDTEKNVKIRGIYPKAAMLSHDCRPNTRHVFLGSEFKMKIISTVDILKNHIISANYTQSLWRTFERREHLWKMKYFWCSCQRCTDPTEFGTYIGSLICGDTEKCKGYVVPKNSLDNKTDWKCEKCFKIYQNDRDAELNSTIREKLRNVVRHQTNTKIGLKNFINELLSTIDQSNSNLHVHEKNYHIIEAKHALWQIYIRNIRSLNSDEINELSKISEDLLEIANALEPGLTKFRGELLFWIYASKFISCRENITQENLNLLNEYRKQSEIILNPEPEYFNNLLRMSNIESQSTTIDRKLNIEI